MHCCGCGVWHDDWLPSCSVEGGDGLEEMRMRRIERLEAVCEQPRAHVLGAAQRDAAVQLARRVVVVQHVRLDLRHVSQCMHARAAHAPRRCQCCGRRTSTGPGHTRRDGVTRVVARHPSCAAAGPPTAVRSQAPCVAAPPPPHRSRTSRPP